MMPSNVLDQVTAFDGLFSRSIVRELRSQVSAMTRSPATQGISWWFDLASPPRTFFEQVATMVRPLIPTVNHCIGVEWWMRAQRADSGFKFHFDRDEAFRSQIVSPHFSSILYLSDEGGPTLIVNRRASDFRAPTAGVAIHPRPARLGIFPGTLFHGVLGGAPSRWPRIAMFMNWWAVRPHAPTDQIAPEILSISPLKKRKLRALRPLPPHEGPEPFAASLIMSPERWRALQAAQTTAAR